MNLLQLSQTIGQRIGLVQQNDINACKSFLQIRYDQLWRSFLWRDSLIEYVLPIDPSATYLPTSNYLPTKGHLILPPIFGQVIACRTNANSMNVQRPMLYYRMSQDEFTKGGSPLEFYLLSAAVWEFDTIQALTLAIANTADASQIVTLDLGATDGVSINRSQVALVSPSVSVGNSDLIYSLIKPVTQGVVSLNTSVMTMQLTDLSAPKCQRIRFMSIPNGAVTVRVLGKRITPPLSDDSDSPVVNGMDGVLFALGYYDMCARKNAQGTPESQAAILEAVGPNFLTKGVAGGFLGKLIEEEVIQAASNTRIIPEGGFGDTGGNFGSWATKASPY